MIETILAFLLSSNFTLLITAITAVLAVISGYLGKKHSKVKSTVDMLIHGIEIANSPDTKKIIKDLVEGHSLIKTIDFEKQVADVTEKIKTDSINSVQDALIEIESKVGIINNLRSFITKFTK